MQGWSVLHQKIHHESDALLRPTRDAEWANAVVNHPDVLPGLNLGIFDSLDLTPILASPRNHLLMGEFGGALLTWTAPRVFDVHDFVLPLGRGAWAKQAAKEVIAFAFGGLDARLLWTETPVENRASRMFNRIIGFKSEGIETAPLFVGGDPVPVEYFVMEAPSCR